MSKSFTIRSAIQFFRNRGHRVWVQDSKHTSVSIDGEIITNEELLRRAAMTMVDS